MISYPLYNTSKIIIEQNGSCSISICILDGSLRECNFFEYDLKEKSIKFNNNKVVKLTTANQIEKKYLKSVSLSLNKNFNDPSLI